MTRAFDIYPHYFMHDDKQYRTTAIFEYGNLTASPYPVCECEFFYKGKWHPVRNYAMCRDFGKMLAVQGLPVACRFFPLPVTLPKEERTIEFLF